MAASVAWETIEDRLGAIAPELRTSVGYYPIFESATALCVAQLSDSTGTRTPVWEIDSIREALWEESRLPSPRVRLAIDRRGQIYAFKGVAMGRQ